MTESKVVKDAATVGWKPPKDDGGCDILKYTVERRDAKRQNWIQLGVTDGKTLEQQATHLTERSQYFFRVCAENEVGQGPFLEMKEPVTPKSQFGELLMNPAVKNSSRVRRTRRRYA